MAYLGIDQSYTGFATTLYGPVDITIVESFKGTGIARLSDIYEHVNTIVREARVKFELTSVCMEGYAHGAKFGREMAGELGAVVKMALYHSQITPTIVPPTLLKKFVLGKGVGHKNEMLLGVYKRWGVEFKNDNAADSYALARLAEIVEHPHRAKFQYEHEVLAALSGTAKTKR